MQNQFHDYALWEAEALRRGCVIEPSGDGRKFAATGGVGFGEWDPVGFGWFWSKNSILAGIDPRTIEVQQWPKL